MLLSRNKLDLPSAEQALPGRTDPIVRPTQHTVLGTDLEPPFPAGVETAVFGLGCFWGAERRFWQLDGVHTTAAGYAGGHTPNPTYEELCTGRTGHAEVILVAFRAGEVGFERLLEVFWESHDPTQGMRQGNDVGTQYRSAIYAADRAQLELAIASRDRFQERLQTAGFPEITTEITEPPAPVFYYAEDYHQQYLDKNPNGYCGLVGTGVSCAVGVAVE